MNRNPDGTVMNRAERRRRDHQMRKAGVPSLDEMERRYAGALAVAELANDDEQARKLVADLKRLYKWYGAHWGIYPDNEDEAKADVPARESDSGRDVADV